MIEIVKREWGSPKWNILPSFGEWQPTGWKIVADPDREGLYAIVIIDDFGFEMYRTARPPLTGVQLDALMSGELVNTNAWQYIACQRADVGGLNPIEMITIYRQFGTSGRRNGAPCCDHAHTSPPSAFACSEAQSVVALTAQEDTGLSASIILASEDGGHTWRRMTAEEVAQVGDDNT